MMMKKIGAGVALIGLLALTGCNDADTHDHPGGDHPTSEHPTNEHSETEHPN